jgi:hypothetical protein
MRNRVGRNRQVKSNNYFYLRELQLWNLIMSNLHKMPSMTMTVCLSFILGQELDGQKLSIVQVEGVKKVHKVIKKNDRWQKNNNFK